jgi:hypothetical protein
MEVLSNRSLEHRGRAGDQRRWGDDREAAGRGAGSDGRWNRAHREANLCYFVTL